MHNSELLLGFIYKLFLKYNSESQGVIKWMQNLNRTDGMQHGYVEEKILNL